MNLSKGKSGFLKMFSNYSEIKCKLWLCLPAVVTHLFDSVVTLLGQSSKYWGGQYNQVAEGNPVSHFALTTHPLVYLVYTVFQFMIISVLIIVFPLLFSKIFSTAWTMGSAAGIISWLLGRFHIEFWIAGSTLFIPATILVYAFERCHRQMTLRDG